MYFPNYSQFFQPNLLNGCSRTQYTPIHTSFPLMGNHDTSYLQFTQTILNRLVATSSPTNLQKVNPFCPICLRIVENSTFSRTCHIRDDRNYLIHEECLANNQSYVTQSLKEPIQNALAVEQLSSNNKYKFQFGLDLRNFYIDIAFMHPISQKSFIKISKKVQLVKDHFNLHVKEEEQESLFPNIILLPVSDYHVQVSLAEIGKKENQQKFTKYISFRSCKQNKRLLIKCEEITLQAEVISKKQQKLKLIGLMNYKYRFPIHDSMPVLRILSFSINIPKEFQESDEDYIGSSNIVEKLLSQKEDQIRTSQYSPIKNGYICDQTAFINPPKNIHNIHETKYSYSSSQNQAEQVNLAKLINTSSLVQYVKNNNQSRLFQGFLDKATAQEIQMIITHVKSSLIELITHEYGNYMAQKLFKVCSPLQRLLILHQISPKLIELITTKQGTHTIQAFIQSFTLNQQYSLASIQIMHNFYELCRDNNSTHFIQKVLKLFPLQYTINFFHYITENLLCFALDRNAMCVIKQMMRRLRQLDDTQKQYSQAIDIVRKQIIFSVTFNVDQLIMDKYGNYVIQFCYQLFQTEKCSGITERILSKFAYYAKEKYSSDVLLKCIKVYWSDKSIYRSLKIIDSKQISEIFRNKDGNKVLLQMMEKLQGTEFWDWLYGILIQTEPTKYYYERWGVCLGSRSGQVGTRFVGFPEKRKKTYNKRY